MNKSIRLMRLWGVMAGGLVLSAVGCGGGQREARITIDEIHQDMSPELETVALTRRQHETQVYRTVDTNLREMIDDVNSSWLLLDRPSRGSIYPVP